MALGWEEVLEELWTATSPMQEEDSNVDSEADEIVKSKDEKIEDEIAALTKEVDTSLKISNEHTAQIRNQLKE